MFLSENVPLAPAAHHLTHQSGRDGLTRHASVGLDSARPPPLHPAPRQIEGRGMQLQRGHTLPWHSSRPSICCASATLADT